MTNTIYDIDLERNAANFQSLTLLTFLSRAAMVFPELPKTSTGKVQKFRLRIDR